MDAGFAAVLGSLAGAIGAAGQQVVASHFQRRAAKDQRQHEIDMCDAQQKHEFATATQAARVARISEWRAGLHAASLENAQWMTVRDRLPELEAPNIVNQSWFQSLRPHLDSRFRLQDRLLCDDRLVIDLGDEIERIEREWAAI